MSRSDGFAFASGRRGRALLGAVLAVAFSFAPALNAAAATKQPPACQPLAPTPPSPCTPPIMQVGWFWMSNTQVTVNQDKPVDAAPDTTFNTNTTGNIQSPITLGHLGVSMKNGNPDMRSYLMFDTGIPAGAEVLSFTFTLTVSRPTDDHSERHAEFQEQGRPPATANDDQAAIQVCAVTSPWGAPAEGDPPRATTIDHTAGQEPRTSVERIEPHRDCGIKGTAERAQNGTKWSFDITPIAKRWVDGSLANNGVSLEPLPNSVAPNWTVEFHGARDKRPDPTPPPDKEEAEIEFVSASEAVAPVAEFTGGTLPPPPPPPAGGFGPTVLPPVATTPGTPSFGSDPAAPTAPPPPPPVATGPGTGSGGGGRTPAWVWTLLPLAALGLGLVSGAIGEDDTAVAGTGNRVAQVLRGRRLARATEADGDAPTQETLLR